ncbi:hypothetical protein BT93_J0792 [Corymbia citriodora subsp. variegata]|nr:hypothetical protein BT93_J0792 [Corymbia citriodora subsp. variegata]
MMRPSMATRSRMRLPAGGCFFSFVVVLGFLVTYENFRFFSVRLSSYPMDMVKANAGGKADIDLSTGVYHSWKVFKTNYEEMERKLRVFVYPYGHRTPRRLTGKYASEGFFFKNIRESRFTTLDPNEAHLFFLPVSCHKLRGQGASWEDITNKIGDYVWAVMLRYPYWNRTLGADHFFVTCHDIGVRATEGIPLLVKNSIRVVCSSSYNNGYIPHKDVALPKVRLPYSYPAGGNDVITRKTLGFWAGRTDSDVRSALTTVWSSDAELDIQNSRKNGTAGKHNKFYGAKFCICPGKSEVNSPWIAESIHYGCVPVIMSDYYDLPFNDILDWRKFSVILKESDVYQLKHILQNISDAEFMALHQNLVKVQRHFMWNTPPMQYDAFHLVMYELWLRHHLIKY